MSTPLCGASARRKYVLLLSRAIIHWLLTVSRHTMEAYPKPPTTKPTVRPFSLIAIAPFLLLISRSRLHLLCHRCASYARSAPE